MEATAMPLKRSIFLVNLYTFCVGTIFILPVIVPYYKMQLGLSFQDLLIGEAIFAFVVIVLEVPSGWMSDVWSRKKTLMFGTLTAILGYLTLIFAQGFWSAMAAQAILGVGVACNSGTVTSLLYDSLAAKGKTHLYQRLEGKRHGTGLYAVALGAIGGGILYGYDVRLPLIFDIGTLILAMIAVMMMEEPERVKRESQSNPLIDMLQTMRYTLHGHKEIAGIIIVSTVLFCSTKMFMWTQQPYMLHVGIPVDYFGFIMAGGFLFGGLMGHMGHKIPHRLTNRFTISLLVSLCIFAAFIAIITQVQMAIIAIIAIAGVWGYGFPFVQNAINKHADPARRATILSSMGLLISMMFIPTSLILGWLSEHYSIIAGLGYIAGQLAVLAIIGLWLWHRGVSENREMALER